MTHLHSWKAWGLPAMGGDAGSVSLQRPRGLRPCCTGLVTMRLGRLGFCPNPSKVQASVLPILGLSPGWEVGRCLEREQYSSFAQKSDREGKRREDWPSVSAGLPWSCQGLGAAPEAWESSTKPRWGRRSSRLDTVTKPQR